MSWPKMDFLLKKMQKGHRFGRTNPPNGTQGPAKGDLRFECMGWRVPWNQSRTLIFHAEFTRGRQSPDQSDQVIYPFRPGFEQLFPLNRWFQKGQKRTCFFPRVSLLNWKQQGTNKKNPKVLYVFSFSSSLTFFISLRRHWKQNLLGTNSFFFFHLL